MLTSTEAIVLKTQSYTEADLIVTYLTPGSGIIKTYAKSPRKTKSRFGSSLEPLTHAQISLWGKEQTMQKITQSDILHSYQSVRENFHAFIHISKFTEILVALTPEGAPNRKLFSLFLGILNLLDSAGRESRDSLYQIAQIRLLTVLGYAPRLKGCGKCGSRSYLFYAGAGSTLCSSCALKPMTGATPPVRVTDKTIQFYEHAIDWPISTAQRLRPSPDTVAELSAVLDAHLSHLIDRKLNTIDFLSKLG